MVLVENRIISEVFGNTTGRDDMFREMKQCKLEKKGSGPTSSFGAVDMKMCKSTFDEESKGGDMRPTMAKN